MSVPSTITSLTFGQITGSVRYRGNWLLPPGNSYDDDDISTGLMLDFGASAYKECYDTMVTADADRFVITGSVTPTAEADLYQLPVDCYRVRGVDGSAGSLGGGPLDAWVRLEPYMFAERDSYRGVAAVAGPFLPRYHLEGNNLRLSPAPLTGVGTSVRLWYVPRCRTITSDSDVLDMVDGWEECLVQMVLIRCRIHRREPVADDRVELQRQLDRLLDNSRDRDRGSPKRAVDPRSTGNRRRQRRSPFGW